MKLEQLTIDGAPSRQPIQLNGFSNGLTFIYGENSSGKSSVGRFLRETLFPTQPHGVAATSSELLAGRTRVNLRGQHVELHRLPNQTKVQPIGANISTEIYDAAFNFSFKNTHRNANRLAAALHRQLDVPIGAFGGVDASAMQIWNREQEAIRLQLANVEARINALGQERSELLQVQATFADRQNQLASLDAQIADLQRKISDLDSNRTRERLSQIEAEIQTLRLRIDNARTEVIYPVADKNVDHSPLYSRLDELENQIRRWRHVQTDVQNQRIRLRDEMLVWNELTLDSDEHPYHTAREILVRLESKVDQAERSANHWADVGNERVDTEQLAGTLGQLCQTMRDDLYNLCNELAHQYKHLRHKAAATELKQLRRCYTEMGENIERLVQRRAGVVKEIQQYDPAGAEAIVRSETQFCQCAQHEGYLEARKRYVGPLTATAPEPVRIEPDLTHERSRLTTLEAERTSLQVQMSHFDADTTELNRQLGELVRQRDLLLGTNTSFDQNRLASIDIELGQLKDQHNQLLAQANQPKPAPVTNYILETAARWLPKLTNGEISKAYLGSSTLTVELGLLVQNAAGQPQAFESLQPSTQDQIYLSLALATKEYLQTAQSIELPIVIDDAFSRIAGDRITPTFDLLAEVANRGHQIILLSQHRYLADRAPGITVLQLNGDQAIRQPTAIYSPVPVSAVSDPSGLREQVSQSQLSQNTAAPYPLSKYRRNDEVLVDSSPRIYSVPQESISVDFRRHESETSRRYSAVPVNNFTQPHPVDGAIGETTNLAATGLFDSADIRFFENNGLYTIGDLLAVDDAKADQIRIGEEQLEEWQTHVLLMICIPSLQVAEARTLSACGITSPKQMASFHARDLFDRIQQFLRTNHGQQQIFIQSINFDRVRHWMDALDQNRSRWQGRSQRRDLSRSGGYQSQSERSGTSRTPTERSYSDRGSYDRAPRDRSQYNQQNHERPNRNQSNRELDNGNRNRERRSVSMSHGTRTPSAPRSARAPREERQNRPSRTNYTERNTRTSASQTAPAIAPIRASHDRDQRNSDRSSRSSSKSKRSSNPKLKFYLNLDDQLEAAPSIGPRTAERFEKIGVITVSDFLKQTAESMADKLNYKRINADTIRQWQHQARLNCRVPNLRGHDVQLLVGCEITEAEELATMQPQNLFEMVEPFAESKEGLKIIRSGKKPDLAEITDWITWAAENRSIQAA
jgi:predicted flap endonuclease-1-like 5' DNA nuclease